MSLPLFFWISTLFPIALLLFLGTNRLKCGCAKTRFAASGTGPEHEACAFEGRGLRNAGIAFLVAALLLAGVLVCFVSRYPLKAETAPPVPELTNPEREQALGMFFYDTLFL